MLCGIGGLPGPGTEPVSPASAGGFLTTGALGKACGEGLLKRPLDVPSKNTRRPTTTLILLSNLELGSALAAGFLNLYRLFSQRQASQGKGDN